MSNQDYLRRDTTPSRAARVAIFVVIGILALLAIGLAGGDEYRTKTVERGCLTGESGSECQTRVGGRFEVISDNGVLHVEAK